jgi:hypothetical protein
MDYISDAFNDFINEDFVCDDARMHDAMTSVLDKDDDPRNFGFDPCTTSAPLVGTMTMEPFVCVAPPTVNSTPLFPEGMTYVPPHTHATFISIGGQSGVPEKVVYFSQGRKKELNEETASMLTFKYNIDLIDFSFPAGKDTKQADNLMLGWRVGKRMKTMGYDDKLIDRVICVLGNRYCLGCAKKTKGGTNGDIIAGTMHCNQCAPHAVGSIDDHIDEFLAMDFNKWARNIKSA